MTTSILASMAKIAITQAIKATATALVISRSGATPGNVAEAGQGRTVWEDINTLEVFNAAETRADFLIWPADYQLDGAATKPAPGDRLTVDDGTTVYTWEVNAPQPEPAFRYTDRFRTAWRVHTRLVAEAPSA